MGYVTNNLMANERILYVGKIHWFIFVSGIFMFLISTALFSIIIIFEDEIKGGEAIYLMSGLIAFIISIVSLIKAFIFKISTELAITSKRVIAKVGFISRNTVELNHKKVESFIVDQSIFGRIFGFGTIVVCGTGGGQTPIPNIDNPLEFRRQAMQVADEAEVQK